MEFRKIHLSLTLRRDTSENYVDCVYAYRSARKTRNNTLQRHVAMIAIRFIIVIIIIRYQFCTQLPNSFIRKDPL